MDASFLSAQRLLGRGMPGVRATVGIVPTLETLPPAGESPRLAAVSLLEDRRLTPHRVTGELTPTFAAFLDGRQTSRVIAYIRGVPVVHGIAAAVIRERRHRRLRSWRPGEREPAGLGPDARPATSGAVQHAAVYAPRVLVRGAWDAMVAGGLALVDTGIAMRDGDTGVGGEGAHPAALIERARHFVEIRRERLERELAEAWCNQERRPLWVDGSIARNAPGGATGTRVGVVTRHATIYGSADAVGLLAALEPNERTSAFRVASGGQSGVASWYLRLRDSTGHDPLWGLVRVEVAEELTAQKTNGATTEGATTESATTEASVTDLADEVSRWVLAERAPASLPEVRWAETAYGVRDCKEMLRAIM